MPADSLWMCIDVLATAFEGNREAAEQTINELERDVIRRPRAERDEIRRKIIVIVAGMSRLEVRLINSDGPAPAAV